MAQVLLDVEVIEGCKVREIIEEFEKRHNLPSRLAHRDKVAKEQCAKEERQKAREDEISKSEEESNGAKVAQDSNSSDNNSDDNGERKE